MAVQPKSWGEQMWEPKLSRPFGGEIKVFLSEHPGVERLSVLEEAFDPEVLDANRVAEVVLEAVWSLRQHTDYGVQITRHDVNWGADISLVEVVVDISSVMASTCTIAELAARIRDRLQARREQGEGDS